MLPRSRVMYAVLLGLLGQITPGFGDDRSPFDRRLAQYLELWKQKDPEQRLEALRCLGRLGPRAAPAVPALIAGLADGDRKIRREAAHGLWRIGPAANPAVPALTAALKDPDRKVREEAALALMTTRPDPKAVIPELVASLRAEPDRRCLTAGYTLEALGEPAVPALIPLMKERDPKVRVAAARALGGIGPGAIAALPGLIDALREPDRETRDAMAGALTSLGPKAIGPLCLALRDHDPKVRGSVALALGTMNGGAAAAVPALIEALADPDPPGEPDPLPMGFGGQGLPRPERRPSAYEAALRDIGAASVPALRELLERPDRDERVRALRALATVGYEARRAVPRLVALLDDAALRQEAGSALAAIGPPARRAIPRLIAALGDPDAAFRARAASAIGRIGGERQVVQFNTATVVRGAIAPLTALLDDRDPRVRAAAVRALEEIGAEASGEIPGIRRLMHDPEAEVRQAVLGALGRMNRDPEFAINEVVGLLNDPDPRVRRDATQFFTDEDLAVEDVVAGLLSALKDGDADVRALAAHKLARTNGSQGLSLERSSVVYGNANNRALARSPNAGARLRAALADPDPRVRTGAAYALPVFQGEAVASVPLLIDRLKDSDELVRMAAAVALAQFGAAAKDAVPALLDALADRSGVPSNEFSVATKAARALEALGPEAEGLMRQRLAGRAVDAEDEDSGPTLRTPLNGDRRELTRCFQRLRAADTPRLEKVGIVRVLGQSMGGGPLSKESDTRPADDELRAALPALQALSRKGETRDRICAMHLIAIIEDRPEATAALYLEALREGLDDGGGSAEIRQSLEPEAVPALVPGLSDPDPKVRSGTAAALAGLGEQLGEFEVEGDNPEMVATRTRNRMLRPEALAALVAALEDPEPIVRWNGSIGLGSFEDEADTVIPALLGLLKRETGRIPPGAAELFPRNLESTRFFNRAYDLGQNEKEGDSVRIAAIQSLGCFGVKAGEATSALVRILTDDKDPRVRWHAAGAVAQIGPDAKAAVPALIAILKSNDVVIGGRVSFGNGNILKEDAPLRLAASLALGGIGPDAAIAVPDLIRTLADPDTRVRLEAAAALGAIGPGAGRAVPALAGLLLDDTINEVAARALGAIGEPGIPALLDVFHGADPELRLLALGGLAEAGTKAVAALPDLLRAVKEPDEKIREAVTDALGAIGASPDAGAAIPALRHALEDSERDVRVSAAQALGAIGARHAEVVPALIGALRMKDPDVRGSAVQALIQIGLPVLGSLGELLDDPEEEVRQIADAVIESISPTLP